MRASARTFVALLAISALHSSARAQDRIDHTERHTLALAVSVGTLINLDRTIDGTRMDEPTTGLGLLDHDSEGLANEGSLAVTLSYLYPLSRYAALGLQAQGMQRETRRDYLLGYPQAVAFDLSLLPRVQLPIARRVTLIASMPFGLSWNAFNAGIPHRTFREDASTELGYNLSIFAGAQVAILEYLGVRAELGVSWHWLNNTWHYTTTTDQALADTDEQVTLESTTLFVRVGAYLPL